MRDSFQSAVDSSEPPHDLGRYWKYGTYPVNDPRGAPLYPYETYLPSKPMKRSLEKALAMAQRDTEGFPEFFVDLGFQENGGNFNSIGIPTVVFMENGQHFKLAPIGGVGKDVITYAVYTPSQISEKSRALQFPHRQPDQRTLEKSAETSIRLAAGLSSSSPR